MAFKKLTLFSFIILLFLLFSSPKLIFAATSRDVVISEIAWSGTSASTSDEWVELYNNTDTEIDLEGWTLRASDGSPEINLSNTIPAKGYYLLERSDSNTTSISEDKIFTGAIGNDGETLELKDGEGNLIDSINPDGGEWPAGTSGNGTPPYASMERKILTDAGDDSNWVTNDGITQNGEDTEGNPIKGTPKNPNSQGYFPSPTPTEIPTPTLIPTSTPIPTSTKTPTPIKTPTSTKTPTPTLAKSPTPTQTSSLPNPQTSTKEESTSSTKINLISNIDEVTPKVSKNNPKIKAEVLGTSSNNQPNFLIILGIILILISCGILSFKKVFKKLNLPNSENELYEE
ncbi:lamin tail domain-containing protein [Candidatus Parcubacteria bacterium]|nr:MAG: lamin tail domain-containing protein [Candidatus Parcubacteria bacterium]